jgi:uncharacterized membrane protein
MNNRRFLSMTSLKKILSYVIVLGVSLFFITNHPLLANQPKSTNAVTVAQTTKPKVEEFVSRGTEPFWSIDVTAGGIVYSTPETKKTFPYIAPLSAAGRTADSVRVYRLRGKGDNLLIIKKENSCSDGMSDKDYPYSATFISGNRVLDGCAEKK